VGAAIPTRTLNGAPRRQRRGMWQERRALGSVVFGEARLRAFGITMFNPKGLIDNCAANAHQPTRPGAHIVRIITTSVSPCIPRTSGGSWRE
jgi:hypothetical protein